MNLQLKNEGLYPFREATAVLLQSIQKPMEVLGMPSTIWYGTSVYTLGNI